MRYSVSTYTDRYSISSYTDGPAMRWNVIDRRTQEWVRRFSTEQEAREYAARLERDDAHAAERRLYEDRSDA